MRRRRLLVWACAVLLIAAFSFVGSTWLLPSSPFRKPPAPPLKRLLVVSYGGVATTYVTSELNRLLRGRYRVNDPDDRDGLKHLPLSERSLRRLLDGGCGVLAADGLAWTNATVACGAGGLRRPHAVLYLLGDPLEAAASHFRRHIAASVHARLRELPPRAAHATPWLTNYSAWAAETAARGVDVFGFTAHLQSWADTPQLLPAPVLFATLGSLARDASSLEDFLSVPRGTVQGGLAIKPRTGHAAEGTGNGAAACSSVDDGGTDEEQEEEEEEDGGGAGGPRGPSASQSAALCRVYRPLQRRIRRLDGAVLRPLPA